MKVKKQSHCFHGAYILVGLKNMKTKIYHVLSAITKNEMVWQHNILSRLSGLSKSE